MVEQTSKYVIYFRVLHVVENLHFTNSIKDYETLFQQTHFSHYYFYKILRKILYGNYTSTNDIRSNEGPLLLVIDND